MAAILINEVRDGNEYFELFGDPNQSLAGLHLVVLDSGAGGNAGQIREAYDLGSFSLDANGFFLVADSNTLSPDILDGDIQYDEQDVLLLVQGFSGAIGNDLDAGNDGSLDSTPWTTVVDVVKLEQGGFGYGFTGLFPDDAQHAFRAPDGGVFIEGAGTAVDPAIETPGAPNINPRIEVTPNITITEGGPGAALTVTGIDLVGPITLTVTTSPIFETIVVTYIGFPPGNFFFMAIDDNEIEGTQVIPVTVTVTSGTVTNSPLMAATITILDNDFPPNTEPEADDIAVTLTEDGPAVEIDLLAGASDADGDTLTVATIDGVAVAAGETVTLASGATVTLGADGVASYDPAGAFEALGDGESAADGFGFSVSDGEGGTAFATVSVTVEGVNDAPVAGDDAAEVFASQAAATLLVLGNDTDAEGGPLAVTALDTAGLLGTASISGDGSRIFYTPGPAFAALAEGATATETLGYTVSDGEGGSATATVTLTVRGTGAVTPPPPPPPGGVNQSPVARNDLFTAVAGATEVTGSVFADNGSGPDDDPDGDPISVILVNGAPSAGATVALPSGAELRLDADGGFVYEPAGSGPAVDTFTYLVSDGEGGADEAVVTIRLLAPPPEVEVIPGTAGDDEFAFDDLDTPRRVEAGEGDDTATLPGAFGDFAIEPIEGGFRFVPEEGEPIEFLSVETFVLDDATLVVSTDADTIKIALMYDVAFDRLFDTAGITFWDGVRAAGTPVEDIADLFAASGEFEERFGADLDAGEFFDVLYDNAFGREADAEGREFWVDALESGGIDRGDAILFFACSEELAELNENAIDDGILLLA